MTNVIEFNKALNETRNVVTKEQFFENLKNIKYQDIDQMTDAVLNEFLSLLSSCGLDLKSTELETDICFLAESVRSLISKIYGLDHTFHNFAEQIFIKHGDGNFEFINPEFKMKTDANT